MYVDIYFLFLNISDSTIIHDILFLHLNYINNTIVTQINDKLKLITSQ